MVKISQLFQGTNPALSDPVPGNEGTTTKRWLWSTIRDLFFKNIPTTAVGGMYDHVISGGVWSGDSYGSTLNASMTAITCRVGGVYVSVGAVTARAFTASKDTYVDILSNGDGTGSVVYTEVTNNAASPALAGSSIRIAIIVTGAGNIANAGSVNQGQESKVLPIASSIPYAVTDSLGNKICTRLADSKLLGYKQILSSSSTAGGSAQLVTGLSATVIVPTNGCKIRVTAFAPLLHNGTVNGQGELSIWEGTVGSGTRLARGFAANNGNAGTGGAPSCNASATYTPSSGQKTINVGLALVAGSAAQIYADSTTPAYVRVEIDG